ncbi:hypothetical protein Daudx_0734 [Candidatus Desulforudis audaxviator]|nr:hypothetical protein Daudx_0734 [Candidatus Desulforudis audaxviator]
MAVGPVRTGERGPRASCAVPGTKGALSRAGAARERRGS